MDSSTDRVAALEERCQKLEKSNLQQFQKEVLQELYKIKQALLEGDSQDIRKGQLADQGELLAKYKIIQELENENKKLNYRILHLTRNLRAVIESK